jgi:hypothetical protein
MNVREDFCNGSCSGSTKCRISETNTTRGKKLSNGHSPANLSNSSTRRKFANFGEFEYSPKWPFLEIFQTRQTRIRQTVTLRSTRQTQICQNYGKFGEFGKFGKFGEFGEFSEGRLDRFIP